MKKFLGFCGSLALALIVLGLILWGVGYAAVGPDAMNEMVQDLTHGKVQMDLQGIRIDEEWMVKVENVLESNARYDIDDANMFAKDQKIWKDNVDKTKVAGSETNELEIELGGCMFEIKDSGDDAFYITYEGTGKTQAYAKNNKLYIKVLNGNDWSLINWGTTNVKNCMTLYMPLEKTLSHANIELGAGQMKLDQLKVQEVEMDLGAGQIVADGLQAEKLDISVGAGEMVLKNASLQNVQVEVGAGNCEIQGEIAGDMEAECAVGNITFRPNGEEQDFNYEIQCVGGNITIGSTEYSGLSQEKSVNNNASKTMDLECAMGNVEVEFGQ